MQARHLRLKAVLCVKRVDIYDFVGVLFCSLKVLLYYYLERFYSNIEICVTLFNYEFFKEIQTIPVLTIHSFILLPVKI